MAQIRDILINISVGTAIRSRKCHRSRKHKIEAGQAFLSVRESSGLGSKNYCKDCAQAILETAKGKMEAVFKEVGCRLTQEQ